MLMVFAQRMEMILQGPIGPHTVLFQMEFQEFLNFFESLLLVQCLFEYGLFYISTSAMLQTPLQFLHYLLVAGQSNH